MYLQWSEQNILGGVKNIKKLLMKHLDYSLKQQLKENYGSGVVSESKNVPWLDNNENLRSYKIEY